MANEQSGREDAATSNPEIERAFRHAGIPDETKPTESMPIYRILGREKHIPVSRHAGPMWKSRRDAGMRRMETEYQSAWNEAIEYYKNDQVMNRRATGGQSSRTRDVSEESKLVFSETENIVFANTSAIVPTIYAKNPRVEITATKASNEQFAKVGEKLINTLIRRKAHPSLRLKSTTRRAIVCTALTNVAYVECGYTFKAQSSEEALQQLDELARELEKARSQTEIEKIEGKIAALEDTVDVLRPEGPWVKFRRMNQVVRDPTAESEDLSDDRWIMIWDFVPTRWLQAQFAREGEDGTMHSLYEATHILPANRGEGSADGRNTAEVEVESYELLSGNDKGATYGYDDAEGFRRGQMTKVWYVWDRTTRRVYLFHDTNWSWPIWVWDDPYHLDTFFPVDVLTFYTDPIEGFGKGEATYYLDQQDAINEINTERRNARRELLHITFYDRNKTDRSEIERITDTRGPRIVGIDVPEGMTLNDFVLGVTPSSMQFEQLFDKGPYLEAIYRISSVKAALQGNEFRTNTTNRAIEHYQSTQATRIDEKIDAVEDFIGAICWKVLQMCMQFMPSAVVVSLIGETAAGWQQHSASEIAQNYSLQVVGGSTQKPNSQAKQEMAIQVGQVLGQFSQAAPTVVLVMLRVLERAFDEIVIQQEDWDAIIASIEQAVGASSSRMDGGVSQGGGPTPQGGEGAQLMQIIDALPPQAKQALGQAIAQGVPIAEAVQRILQVVQQQQQQPQQPQDTGNPPPTQQAA